MTSLLVLLRFAKSTDDGGARHHDFRQADTHRTPIRLSACWDVSSSVRRSAGDMSHAYPTCRDRIERSTRLFLHTRISLALLLIERYAHVERPIDLTVIVHASVECDCGIHCIDIAIKKYEYANDIELVSNTFNACGKSSHRQLVLFRSRSQMHSVGIALLRPAKRLSVTANATTAVPGMVVSAVRLASSVG
jgi:hypothetical protein